MNISPGVAPPDVISAEAYENAQKSWEEEFGPLAKYGWGPSGLAEKWNGRHAMFGWVMIVGAAYAKGHGLIPNADVALDMKQWGSLAGIMGKETITTERAVILAANMHAFGISLMATICPAPWSDPLLIDPNHPSYDRLTAAEGYGYMPDMKPGINAGVEMWHGRFAMLGLTALVVAAASTGKPMLDIVNDCVGGLYY